MEKDELMILFATISTMAGALEELVTDEQVKVALRGGAISSSIIADKYHELAYGKKGIENE